MDLSEVSMYELREFAWRNDLDVTARSKAELYRKILTALRKQQPKPTVRFARSSQAVVFISHAPPYAIAMDTTSRVRT